MRSTWKKCLLGLAVVTLVLGLSSCNGIYGLFNPLIGTWEYSDSSGNTYQFTFNWDNSCGLTETISSTALTFTGTYTQDTSAKTVTCTWAIGASSSTVTYAYSINGNTLTLTYGSTAQELQRK